MIYQAILKIRGKEIPILYYNYRCHIQHHDDLITLAFECSGDEAFFYDWLNEGMMQDGEIHFIYNEVEVADIFRFWDCYCVKIEEYMSVGNAPMMMVVYLSPGIIKRNNLEVREKVWKVSEVVSSVIEHNSDVNEQIIYITDAYWIDEYGNKQRDLNINSSVTLYVQTKNFVVGKTVDLFFEDKENSLIKSKTYSGIIDENGIITIEDFNVK